MDEQGIGYGGQFVRKEIKNMKKHVGVTIVPVDKEG